jgi:sigma-B regulation protein RsbU (phosphoserine phosphatase)
LAPGVENGGAAQQAIARLRQLEDQWMAIFEQSSDYTLWHYLALEQGVAMVYPGHGAYPPDYDPRTRPWYREVRNSGQMRWLPSVIDTSSRQPMLTVAAPLYSDAGRFLGATAIDLPLGQLLQFHSTAQPWLNQAQLMLLNAGAGDALTIIATREPLQPRGDWNASPQTPVIGGIESGVTDEGIDAVDFIDSLQSGCCCLQSSHGRRASTCTLDRSEDRLPISSVGFWLAEGYCSFCWQLLGSARHGPRSTRTINQMR